MSKEAKMTSEEYRAYCAQWERVPADAPQVRNELSVPGWTGNWAKMRVGQRWKTPDFREPHVVVEVLPEIGDVRMRFRGQDVMTWHCSSKHDNELVRGYTLISDDPATPAEKPRETSGAADALRYAIQGIDWAAVPFRKAHEAPPAKTQETRKAQFHRCKAKDNGLSCCNEIPITRGVCEWHEAKLAPPPLSFVCPSCGSHDETHTHRQVGQAADTLGDMMARHPVVGLAERSERKGR